MFWKDARAKHILPAGFPKIQLVLSIFLSVKQLSPKGTVIFYAKLLYHIFTDFVAVLTNRRTDGS